MNIGVILARFQPIHNGHLALIKKAMNENDKVIILIGSSDKINERNPIPWTFRLELVKKAINELNLRRQCIEIHCLPDLTDESDNSHDWGFYLYSKIVSITQQSNFSMYYSDGFEIITSWFPGFILSNNVSLCLLARNATESGISATKIRNMILSDDSNLESVVPKCVYSKKHIIKSFIEVYNSKY